MTSSSYDVVIVGGGAAGLTAAIYTGRKQLKTLVAVGPNPGGETTLTNDIRNYPGYEQGPGTSLMNVFEKQAKTWGAEFFEGKVLNVSKQKGSFIVKLDNGKSVKSKAVILSYGRERRKLNVPGEDKFIGKGASTCVTCDGPLFTGKTVAIIGGGNSAVEGALEMSSIAKKVYLVHRRKDFRADEVTVARVKKLKNVEFVLESSPVEILGDKFVKGMTVSNGKSKKTLAVEGVFIEIGYETNTEIVKGLVNTASNGEIVVDLNCRTKTPGIYAAGDLTITPFKQTVISAGMGATAALEAYRFITGTKGEVTDIKA